MGSDEFVWTLQNKACQKDPFPMSRTEQLVDATVGHPRMSFLDIFQGYHQPWVIKKKLLLSLPLETITAK